MKQSLLILSEKAEDLQEEMNGQLCEVSDMKWIATKLYAASRSEKTMYLHGLVEDFMHDLENLEHRLGWINELSQTLLQDLEGEQDAQEEG
jgi:hypothetical protein